MNEQTNKYMPNVWTVHRPIKLFISHVKCRAEHPKYIKELVTHTIYSYCRCDICFRMRIFESSVSFHASLSPSECITHSSALWQTACAHRIALPMVMRPAWLKCRQNAALFMYTGTLHWVCASTVFHRIHSCSVQIPILQVSLDEE
jgi:hypothetical protein